MSAGGYSCSDLVEMKLHGFGIAERENEGTGIGPITAATIQALVPDPGAFASGRHFAAWVGLTPKTNSSGGKERLGKSPRWGIPRYALFSSWAQPRCGACPSRRDNIAVANRTVGAQTRQSRSNSFGQQNGQDRLGLLTKGGTFVRKGRATSMRWPDTNSV